MFFKEFIVVLALATVLYNGVHADHCAYVATKDCAFIPDRQQVCGTNQQSYRNSCFLAKAYCADNTIHKAHDGPCAVTTTPSPVHGSEVALDIFCLDLIYISCPTGGVQICGNDGKFYENVCEFDKARCFHRDLKDDGTNCV
ncbi:hypothetical protein ACF0H5_017714 [Mactra antiquata]